MIALIINSITHLVLRQRVSIILPTKILTGTVGNELVVKASGTEAPFGPKCEKIPKKNQFWSIQPNLPEGLLMDSATGIISGRTEEKINSTFTLRVSGSGNEFEEKLEISILRPMPSDTVNLIKNFSTDGSSIGHGICEFIDNSIDADATQINIHMSYEVFSNDPLELQRPWIIVEDNGKGISKDGQVNVAALEEALGWATSPDTEYCQSRLGAYGVGLPAAALTSALYCTIFTKKEGEMAIGHMSYDDIDTSGYLRFFDYEDIPGFLSQAKSFQNAEQLMKKKTNGTIILLQDHYQVRSSIQEVGTKLNPHKFKEQLTTVKTRLRDYLSLVYHRYLEGKGVDLRKSNGEKLNRRIRINLSGPLQPLDPLMEYNDSKTIGKLGTHLHEAQSVCSIKNIEQYFKIKMAILPGQKGNDGGYGRLRKDGTDFDTAISNALMVFRSEEAGTARPPPQELQGLYFYRNHRLIEFATWKGMFKQAPQAQVARVAITAPLGLPVHDPKLDVLNDFSVDQRKRRMSTTSKIEEEIKEILSKSRHWHVDDTKQHSVVARAKKRAEYDKLGIKGKAKKKIKQEVAIISPPEIHKQFVPFKIELQDLTQKTGKSPTRQWVLDAKQVGTGQKYLMEINEPGQHKLVLTVNSGKKSWQKSIIFEALESTGKKKKAGKKSTKVVEYKVVPIAKSADDPPIELVDNVYEINLNHPKLGHYLKMMGMLTNDE